MSRFYTNEQRQFHKTNVQLLWILDNHSNNIRIFHTLTMARHHRTLAVREVSDRWNSFRSNFIARRSEVLGWARLIDLHKNGVPHLHMIYVLRRGVSRERALAFEALLRRAGPNHRFGAQSNVQRFRGMHGGWLLIYAKI